MSRDAEALLAELVAEFTEPEIPDGAVTVKDLVSATGKPTNTCMVRLGKMVSAGILGVVKVKGTNYYYRIEATPK